MPEKLINVVGDTVLKEILLTTVGIFVGFFIYEPLKKWLKRKKIVYNMGKDRTRIRVHQLCNPDLPPFDFSPQCTKQNGLQNTFEFAIDEAKIELNTEAIKSLREAKGKKEFTSLIGEILAHARSEKWTGLKNSPPQSQLDIPRDLVITNFPIPGNFYAWNSVGRTLLLVSIRSVEHLFPEGENFTITDFVSRMLQRMAIFSVVPDLDPRKTHRKFSLGCLFDFTDQLNRVLNLIENPYLCPNCQRLIAKSQGDHFSLEVRNWLEGGSLQGGTAALN